MTTWVDVKGHGAGFYQVSDEGDVRRIGGRILKKAKCGGGKAYYFVSLSVNNKVKLIMVHKLVLEAFVGPRPSKRHEARHLDGNKHNNNVKNLAWGTVEENTSDKYRHGQVLIGERHPLAKLTEIEVHAIRTMRKSGESVKDIARKFSVSSTSVSMITNRKLWRHI